MASTSLDRTVVLVDASGKVWVKNSAMDRLPGLCTVRADIPMALTIVRLVHGAPPESLSVC